MFRLIMAHLRIQLKLLQNVAQDNTYCRTRIVLQINEMVLTPDLFNGIRITEAQFILQLIFICYLKVKTHCCWFFLT